MEVMAMSNDAHCPLFENTHDPIESPQYISFADRIPEAKDSFFDRRNQDISAKQLQNNKHYQTLPTDVLNDFIRPLESLGLKDPTIEQENIITSTPFRVEGIQPLPWRVNNKDQATANSEKKTGVKIQPFSFEERNKQLQQRKLDRIKTLLQAEKDARKFRANPVPKFLRKAASNSYPSDTTTNPKSKHKCAAEKQLDSAPPKFRARSPKVLRRPPFKPELPRQPLMLPPSPMLNSEQRAKERKIFDNYLKKKEQLETELRQLREAALKRREEEEIMKMRKKMVPKAQPIRCFKSIQVVQVAKRPLTEPMTPTLIKRQRR